MIYNIIAFLFISALVFTSKNRRALGWLVFCYYALYIIIALDYFGFVVGDVFTTHDSFMIWYLIYTAISLIFFIASIIIYLYNNSKIALFYSCWIILNMFISGLSAIFQAYETNGILIVYNVLQNFNLVVDIMVVILGTDTKIKGAQYVRDNADRVYSFIVNNGGLPFKNSDRFK